MYNNIGVKIKALAISTFIVEAIAAIIGGIVLWIVTKEWWCALILFFGPILAWVSSWLLYGFGELIDNVCKIADNTKTLKNDITSFNTAKNAVNKTESSKEISTKP